jgi:hypothetical protein
MTHSLRDIGSVGRCVTVRVGGPMQNRLDDNSKMRLVERVDIETAISVLQERGYTLEQMLGELVRLFYIDLDEFNELVRAA